MKRRSVDAKPGGAAAVDRPPCTTTCSATFAAARSKPSSTSIAAAFVSSCREFGAWVC